MTRRTKGRTAHHAGHAAEAAATRAYAARGAQVLETRLKTPEGEIDLILRDGNALVFVEVKQRKNNTEFASPVTARQWERLENAANHYIMGCHRKTGVQPVCRFDVALVGHDGQVQIIENARSFDTY
ncbi:MAG: YraN family protein [Pseudomonadota bacterium]